MNRLWINIRKPLSPLDRIWLFTIAASISLGGMLAGTILLVAPPGHFAYLWLAAMAAIFVLGAVFLWAILLMTGDSPAPPSRTESDASSISGAAPSNWRAQEDL